MNVVPDPGSDPEKARYFLEKHWKPILIGDAAALLVRRNLVILYNDDTLFLAVGLQKVLGYESSVLVNVAERLNEQADAYEIATEQFHTGAALAQTILDKHGNPDCAIDLSDWYRQDPPEQRSAMGKIGFYQALIREMGSQALAVIHVTHGLEPWRATVASMAGAVTAGLVRMLSAEYGKVMAKTIDVDNDIIDVEGIARIVSREIEAPLVESEICYRKGERYIPYMERVEVTASAKDFSIDPARVIVVTGGTRGIGAEIANHLVSLGVKKMVIMGQEALPDRRNWESVVANREQPDGLRHKLERLLRLEKNGVTLRVYGGSLADQRSLTDFFATVRRDIGAIAGVIHCAGLARNEHPAFIYKKEEDIRAVFEPKIAGLMALDSVLRQDNLDFFVVFSSISAVVPVLATGISDYVAANTFMNYFVENRRHLGRRCYQSICWPSWKEIGMGENKNPVYLRMGLISHSTTEGLGMFDAVFGCCHRLGIVTPCVVGKQLFSLAPLLQARPPGCVAAPVTAATDDAMADSTDVLPLLKGIFSETLKIAESKLREDTAFNEYGVDSVILAELVTKLERAFAIKLDPSILLENPTLQRLSRYLTDRYADVATRQRPQQSTAPHDVPLPDQRIELVTPTAKTTGERAGPDVRRPVPIAVIGIACHFPKAQDKDSYWRNLANGRDCITQVPSGRWRVEQYYVPTYEPGRSISKWGGFIDGIEYFDPGFFNIQEKDAPHVDPLERQFLEVSVQTLRDAGYEKQALWGKKVGVFVGARVANYAQKIKVPSKNSIIGFGQNFIAAHVSHLFNFRGPSMVVDTACSSSLVSIHLACQSLINGESELALAGGVDILLDQWPYLVLSEARALSPTGKCHTFDERADGFVPGEGCGAVLLKPLEQAIADGDTIYAVIEGSAVNNDGNTMGITTPNPEAQQAVIREALRRANVSAASCSYIEAHGTGTMIGDPMELRALTGIFREHTADQQFCAVGSVKTNFGHLLSAAGIASFIKVALALHHRQLPPTLNCDKPNPRFDFESSPFYLNRELRSWESISGVRRAGISSFGFGGTNAHLILSDGAPLIPNGHIPRRHSLPPVSFKRERYWIDGAGGRHKDSTSGDGGRIDLPKEEPNLSQRFQRFFEVSEIVSLETE